jgi:hypothetical protein
MRQMNRPGVAPARTPQPQARTPQPQARPPQPRQNAHELAKRHVEKLSSNAKASGDVETFLECQGILGAIAALKLGNPSLLRSFGSGTVAKAQGFIDMYKN